jgi:hypothetical protein
MKKIFTVAVATAVATLALTLHAQQVRDQGAAPKPGVSGGISGTVVTDEQTPQPLRRAQVMVVSSDNNTMRTTYTNESGKFSITGLPAGRYSLSASKAPYLRMSYGGKRTDSPGTSITLANASQMTDIVMKLPRGSVIAGRIVDENGEPAFGVNIRVMQSRMQNGERTFVPPSVGSSNDTTDDRGLFRLFGLPAGEYAVIASPRITPGEVKAMTDNEIRAVMQALQQQQAARTQNAQNGQSGIGGVYGAPSPSPSPTPTPTPMPTPDIEKMTVAYAPVYYPGTTTASTASMVTVGSGEEHSGVDFALRLVRTAKVEGQVIVPPGIAPSSVQLMMTPASQIGIGGVGLFGLEQLAAQRAIVGPDGKFTYNAVAPGQYLISASATRSAGGREGGAPPPPGGGNVGFASRVVVTGGNGNLDDMVLPMSMMGPSDPNGTQFWAQADVPVDGAPVSGVTLALQPGMTVSGRVEFRSAMTRPGADFKSVVLNLTPVSTPGSPRITLGAPSMQIDEKGQFTLTGVTPGRYRIAGNVRPGPNQGPSTGPPWRVGSAMFKGRDILDFNLEVLPGEDVTGALVTFTDATQEISGTLQDAAGHPAADYTVIVLPADKANWSATRRIRTARPATDGKYTVTNLPPGDYLIAAVADLAPSEATDPAFLEQVVPAALKITLVLGEKKVQDMRISGGL